MDKKRHIMNTAASSMKRSSRFMNQFMYYKWMYVLFLPVVVYFFFFSYLPIFGVQLAFKNFNLGKGIWGSEWNNFYHFQRLFTSPKFWEVMSNTLEISIKRIVFGFPAPIILALLINEVRHMTFKRVVQTISYMPHFLSWVIIAGILTELLSPSRGVINYIISFLGGQPIYFLTRPEMFQTILIVSGNCASIGWSTILYLAAISGVDEQLYEAALVDGAGRLRCVWNITIPSILPIISILFILGLGSILSAGFDQVFNLYNPQVYSTGDIVDTYVYRIGMISFDYAYSTAVNLFKNVVGLLLVVGTNAIIRQFNEAENALW